MNITSPQVCFCPLDEEYHSWICWASTKKIASCLIASGASSLRKGFWAPLLADWKYWEDSCHLNCAGQDLLVDNLMKEVDLSSTTLVVGDSTMGPRAKQRFDSLGVVCVAHPGSGFVPRCGRPSFAEQLMYALNKIFKSKNAARGLSFPRLFICQSFFQRV